jgi:hypothetical protein
VDVALPGATQVSDRGHLLCNLRDNVERMLQRLGPQMRQAAQQVVVGGATLGRQGLPRGTGLLAWQRLSDDRRAARLALYEKVMTLHTQGGTIKGIARELAIDPRTVRKFIISGAFPERAPRARGPTPLDAHRRFIEERLAQGWRNPRQIWLEVRQRGYTGNRATVQHCVARLLSPQGKPSLVQAPVRTMPCPSARQAFSWGSWDGENLPSMSRRPSTMSDSHKRCARSNPWSLRFEASPASSSASCIETNGPQLSTHVTAQASHKVRKALICFVLRAARADGRSIAP